MLRDLFRDSTILHSVSYVWKIKFARRIQRISEVFLKSSVINKISVKRVTTGSCELPATVAPLSVIERR